MESKEEGSQRSLSGSPGATAAVVAIKGEEALAVCRPQLVLEGGWVVVRANDSIGDKFD